MGEIDIASLRESVSDRVGDDVRAVVRYDAGDVESWLRQDVHQQYSERERKAVVDRTIVSQLGYQRLEDVFDTGALSAIIQRFDDSWIITYPDPCNQKAGLLLSIDRNGTTTMTDVEWCLEFLDEQTDAVPA